MSDILDASPPPASPRRPHGCPDCGLFVEIPALPRGAVARCPRCNALLRRRRTDPHGRALALALTGLLLFAMATQLPFMALELGGRETATTLISGPVQLSDSGLWALGVLVLATTIAAPLAKLALTIYVLLALRLPRPPRHLPMLFRWVERLAPWSMVEVFLLGVFVAYTKLIDLAHVHVGLAVYALGGLMLALAASDAALDDEAVWTALERKGITAAPIPNPRAIPPASRVACTCCGLVGDLKSPSPLCPRCGATLLPRRPNSLARSWALLIAAALLYIPANVLPVMTVISFGHGAPDTILSGVESLAAAGMWPLAALVFFASITVPVLKLIGMTVLLVSTARGSRTGLRERTRLYRIVDSIGRWSMIDVFMVSILTALVRLGAIASVHPGPGAMAFGAVVILTMLGAESFDPRLMWDAGTRP